MIDWPWIKNAQLIVVGSKKKTHADELVQVPPHRLNSA